MTESTGTGGSHGGGRVPRQTREVLTNDIASALKTRPPAISGGSSAESTFLDRIYEELSKADPVEGNAYRKTERILQHLELTYDPFWDTSESSDTGGSTVTNRAYSRIRTAITGVPRCFLVRDFLPAKGEYYYGSGAEGRAAITDAGPASRLLFWNRDHDGQTWLNAHGEIAYIASGWTAPWIIKFTEAHELRSLVSFESVGLGERMPTVTEVTYETYKALLSQTGNSRLDLVAVEDPDPDRGGDVVAERVLNELPLPERAPLLDVPDDLPQGEMEVSPATTPTYTESATEDGPVASDDLPPAPRDRKKAKAAEERAVQLTRQALEADGWVLKRDCQKDGVGYDLIYARGARDLHVEVKGIMSSTLAFNLTPKEAWRVETDPRFVLVAVTNVLSPTAFKLHLLDRFHLASAARVITGYRLRF